MERYYFTAFAKKTIGGGGITAILRAGGFGVREAASTVEQLQRHPAAPVLAQTFVLRSMWSTTFTDESWGAQRGFHPARNPSTEWHRRR